LGSLIPAEPDRYFPFSVAASPILGLLKIGSPSRTNIGYFIKLGAHCIHH
jgi:hypothetical protein